LDERDHAVGSVVSAAFSPNHNQMRIVTASTDGTARVWWHAPSLGVALAEKLVKPLTAEERRRYFLRQDRFPLATGLAGHRTLVLHNLAQQFTGAPLGADADLGA
jgi:hypothetical protein